MFSPDNSVSANLNSVSGQINPDINLNSVTTESDSRVELIGESRVYSFNVNDGLSTAMKSKIESSLTEGQLGKEEFYQHVDERISRNSLEYPETQAAQIRYWLDNADNEGEQFPGNVIGIRGYPKTVSDSSCCRESRLKHKKVVRENIKLRDLLSSVMKQLETEEVKKTARHKHQSAISSVDQEKEEEISQLTVELCRYQVQLAKLELLLDTERKIKQELLAKLDGVEKGRGNLENQFDRLRSDLNLEKLRSMKNESVELDRLHNELSRVQENYRRVEKEKREIDELLQSNKSKLISMDAKYQSDLESARETSRLEAEGYRINMLKMKEERDKMAAQLSRLETQLANLESDKMVLTNDLLRVNRELELANATSDSDRSKAKQVEDLERRLAEVSERLGASEVKNGQLTDELEASRGQIERGKQQVDQIQQRFNLQQRALVELREKKDKELARLRTNLNFEQYNRQVALKGIERELRASLRELEAMKCRFSQRFVSSQGSKDRAEQEAKMAGSPVSGGSGNESTGRHNCKPGRWQPAG